MKNRHTKVKLKLTNLTLFSLLLRPHLPLFLLPIPPVTIPPPAPVTPTFLFVLLTHTSLGRLPRRHGRAGRRRLRGHALTAAVSRSVVAVAVAGAA